jgi:hypothetical protein
VAAVFVEHQEGEPFTHVLEGTLLMELPGHDAVVLHEGDTVLRSQPPGTLTNPTGAPARIICAATPPLR